MALEGYNRWMEYPEEIDEGAKIRVADDYVTVTKTEDIGTGMYLIEFHSEDFSPVIYGWFRVKSDVEIETFTKFVPKD